MKTKQKQTEHTKNKNDNGNGNGNRNEKESSMEYCIDSIISWKSNWEISPTHEGNGIDYEE